MAQATAADDPFSWTNGYSLILTSDLTPDQADLTVDFITDNGGQVAIVVSPRMMLGWASGALVGQHGILAIYTRPVALSVLKGMSIDEYDHLNFFNSVASGTLKSTKAPTYGPLQRERPDAIPRPGTQWRDRINGISGEYPGTSDFMVGKARYNVFFVESNGTIDANTYSWTCADMSTMVSELSAGLSFWSSKAATYGAPLTFNISYNRPAAPGCAGTTKVLQGYEPILHPGACVTCTGYDGDALWVNPIMCNFGFCSGTCWDRVQSFNEASRISAKTNWATSLFIAYNPSPAPTTFTNGYFAYAWVPTGPYSQILWRNDGWSISQNDQTVAHETGHLFGADDEYASSGCADCAVGHPENKYVVNGNCQNCNANSAACMMRMSELALCGYTPGQLGWGLNLTAFKASPNSNGNPEKTNWVPGQTVNYVFTVNMPGKPGECVNVRSRWYRQFQSNLTESEAFDQPCLMTTGGSKTMFLQRTIPAGAQPGEALVEVQLEFYYGGGNYYGRGVRATSRGKFFILPGSANPITTMPTGNLPEPQVVK